MASGRAIMGMIRAASREPVDSDERDSGGDQDSTGLRKRGLQDEVVRRPRKTPGDNSVGNTNYALAA